MSLKDPSKVPLPEKAAAAYDTDARRWSALLNRDPVAEQAGFRACKRCLPSGPSQRERYAEAAARACRLIEAAEAPPALDSLAAAVGLSRFHFHRIFKQVIGLTPRQYAAAHRAKRMPAELQAEGSVTEAIYGAGFSSSSRFYERSPETMGMTPRQFRQGAAGLAIRFAISTCSLGLVLVAGTTRGLCCVHFGDEPAALEAELRQLFPHGVITKSDDDFDNWVKAVVAQIEAPGAPVDLPLDIRGTAFQQRVWQALREIPAGQTLSYTQVAENIGSPSAVRAVAGACAANSVAVLVPCHRVVKSDGQLSGYRWGVERKRLLLQREAEL